MNLAEALNTVPELPAKVVAQKRLPKVDPNLIIREQTQDGKLMIMVMIPKTRRYYPFSHEQWELLQCFDGERTYDEIAERHSAQSGVLYTGDYVKQFAEAIADQPFWYKTAQEQNIALYEKLSEERRRKSKKKSKFGDLAEITFSAWDPNKVLSKLHEKLSFVFSRWFVIANLVLFAFTIYVWIDRWGEIGHDSLQYYNFTQKGFWDLVEFWILIFFVGLLHESSHGLACKHTGGEVHRMGFLLIYLSPCFFCDVTEAWVFGSKWQRIATMAAGLWSEMIVCGFATILWWGLPPGGFVHDLAYKIILIAGVAAILINLNPLCKLDGYYILTEMLEISELKENSTEFTTSWVKKNIFRLPVEVPYVPWRRRLLYVPYSVLSGAYGYVLLFFVVTFSYHVIYRYSPQWAFVPAVLLTLLVFKSRIRNVVRFMQTVYLDKKDWLKAEFKPQRMMAGTVAALVLLFAPVWRENVPGRFVLEPAQRSVLRAQVPGIVVEGNAREGKAVRAGEPLIRMRDLRVESELAKASADYKIAVDRTTQAQLRNADYSEAENERRRLEMRNQSLHDEAAHLVLASDIDGVVVTPRVENRLGSYVKAGTELVEVANLAEMRARIYVSESDLRKVKIGSQAKLHMDGLTPSFQGSVTALAPAASAMEEGVMEKTQYIGLDAPHFYFADITIENPKGQLRMGMTGEAKIFVRRRSLAGMMSETVYDFVSRKLW